MDKNKVFIIGSVIVILLALGGGFLLGYSKETDKEIEEAKTELREVLYVTRELKEKEKVNSTMVKYRKIPKELVRGYIITTLDYFATSSRNLCVKTGMSIPNNSLLYNNYLIDCNELEIDNIDKVEENSYLYQLVVDAKSGTITEGEFVDIDLRYKDENGKNVVKDYILGVPLVSFKDNTLLLEVNDECYSYLEKAVNNEEMELVVSKSKDKNKKFVFVQSEASDEVLFPYSFIP